MGIGVMRISEFLLNLCFVLLFVNLFLLLVSECLTIYFDSLSQIFFATDSIDMNQQQINEVQHNLQTALIEPSQHIQTENVQQQMVMYQTAPQSQQQIIHASPSTQTSQQHHVIVQQNVTPPHQQTINQQAIHQSQPIVITPPQQNVIRQPYTVYSQTHKRVYTAVPQQSNYFFRKETNSFSHPAEYSLYFAISLDVQMQQQQQRILQMGQPIQKTVPRLVTPTQHVTSVQTNPMPRVRATRPRPATTIQQSPRMVTQSPVRVS